MKLTGELLHEGFAAHRPEKALKWEQLEDASQEAYNAVAEWAREKLNLCDDCGLQKPPLLDGHCFECVAQTQAPKVEEQS